MPRIVIVGAGIAGLATALAVADLADVVVLERRSAAEANFGAGIQISPNAFKALRALGAADAVAAVATSPDALVVRSGGTVLTRLDYRGLMEERFGAPYLSLSRAALYQALADRVAARGIEVRFDHELGGPITQRADGVAVPGVGTAVDLVIAADGVRSALRTALIDDAAIDVGWTAWRGRGTAVEGNITDLVMGSNHHLVRYPLSDASENCVLIAKDPATPDTIARTATGPFMADVADWQPWTVRVRTPHLFDTGRVGLVGDASHAAVPFLAQGGALALEDAAVLGAAVRRDGATPRALEAYAAARRSRVARVVAMSVAQGRIYHLGFPLSLARDIALRRAGAAAIVSRMAFVWAWSPES